jgi:hypothetical protein
MRRNSEHAISIETAVRAQQMEMRIISQEIAETLYSDNRTRDSIVYLSDKNSLFDEWSIATSQLYFSPKPHDVVV